MRIDDYDELIAAYKANKLDPTPYYWYTNQSRYGTCPHGGDGLGTERFVVWLLGDNHIHDSCFNPPYINRSESSISFSRGKITSTRLSVDACTRGQPQPTGYAEQSIALLIRLNQYRLCDVHDGRRCVWHVPQSGVTMKHSDDWTTFLSRSSRGGGGKHGNSLLLVRHQSFVLNANLNETLKRKH